MDKYDEVNPYESTQMNEQNNQQQYPQPLGGGFPGGSLPEVIVGQHEGRRAHDICFAVRERIG